MFVILWNWIAMPIGGMVKRNGVFKMPEKPSLAKDGKAVQRLLRKKGEKRCR